MRKTIIMSIVCSMVVSLLCHTPATATIIVENDTGSPNFGVTTYIGQSLTTPPGPGWNNLLFSWLKESTPVAAGTLYLLSSEYLGAPNGLGSSTPGYIASSTGISASQYVFDPPVSVLGNTTYFFYADALFTPGDLTGDGNVYAGGNFYWNGPNGNFPDFLSVVAEDSVGGADIDFRFEGAPVPEPATMLLLGTGLVGLSGFRRKFVRFTGRPLEYWMKGDCD